jgi:hypothetical protein
MTLEIQVLRQAEKCGGVKPVNGSNWTCVSGRQKMSIAMALIGPVLALDKKCQ